MIAMVIHMQEQLHRTHNPRRPPYMHVNSSIYLFEVYVSLAWTFKPCTTVGTKKCDCRGIKRSLLFPRYNITTIRRRGRLQIAERSATNVQLHNKCNGRAGNTGAPFVHTRVVVARPLERHGQIRLPGRCRKFLLIRISTRPARVQGRSFRLDRHEAFCEQKRMRSAGRIRPERKTVQS